MKVLLIGNYANDQQESMLRFRNLLAEYLSRRRISVEILSPIPVFGRLIRSGTGFGKFLGYLDKFLLFPLQLKNRVRRLDSESVVHICDQSNAIYTLVLNNTPHIVSCHDLLAVRSAFGEMDGCRVRASGRIYQRLILKGLNAAQRVACVSTATMRDLKRLSSIEPNRVSLIYNGLNYPYAPIHGSDGEDHSRELAGQFGNELAAKLKTGFILHVGGNHWYKNRPGVLQIYAKLYEKMPIPPKLVMAGKSFTAELKSIIKQNRLEDRVFELTDVSNENLRILYCAAQLLLFPSLEEGFGWPIIEAQACGCRVVIPDREPMNEVGGNAAKKFDVETTTKGETEFSGRAVENAANAVLQILGENSANRSNRVRNGLANSARFSAGGMVESYINLYRQLLNTGEERRAVESAVACPVRDC